jgi:hypothetical protein
VAKQGFHLGDPLRVGGAAQAEAVGVESGPVFAGAQVGPLGKALTPEVLCAFLAVIVMGVAPQPGRHCLLLIGDRLDADDALVECGLGGEQALERRARQFARIPGMIGAHLRIADPRSRDGGRQHENGDAAKYA